MDAEVKSRKTLLTIAEAIVIQHPDILDLLVEHQRKRLSDLVRGHFRGTVAYGPFKGMRLDAEAHWGADHGAMTLGLYEQEVLRELRDATRGRSVFVDLGAADGYYGIGVLVAGMARKSYAFEMSQTGREFIARNADANRVRDRIEIRGEATPEFFAEIDAAERDHAVLLVDIEGAEFEVLTAAAFAAFAKAVVIVEIHDWVDDYAVKFERLKADAAATHTVRAFCTGARDLSGLKELNTLPDTDRWLLCSEGRPRSMSWLRFDPR